VLEEVGITGTPSLLVLNKADAVKDPLTLRSLAADREPEIALAVSARTGEGIDELTHAVERHIRAQQPEAEFRVPAGEGKLLAWLSDHGTIVQRAYEDGMVALRVRLGPADLARAGRMVEEIEKKNGQ